jgi:hypothetical protein
MKKLLLPLLALFMSVSANAGSFGKYGLGIANTAEYGSGTVKNFSLGYNEPWYGPFIQQYEVGLFADNAGHDRRSSGYAFYSLGVEVDLQPLVLRSLWGLGGITSPDSMLGGWFQFTQDLLVGLRDRRGNMIGLVYKHISSAGIYSPNRGRDFLTIQVEIPW